VWLPDPRFLPAAMRLSEDPVPGARALAAQLLGALGGAESAAQVEALLRDEDAAVRAAAATAVGTLGDWRAAPTLAPLLRDSAWDVRRAAGLALRATGAPGAILLRRAMEDQDAFARDMARQVLDLPEGTRVTP
jgi:HEAT repeat protein